MRPNEIADLLSRSAGEVAKHLLPNGKLDSREWRCGSISGEAGKSLGVRLHGDKAGIWSDFATGQTGDLLDLWREVRNISMPEAMAQAATWLGLNPGAKKPTFVRQQKAFKKPSIKPAEAVAGSPVWQYLTQERKLSEATLKAYRVGQTPKSVLFPCYNPTGELVMTKWRHVAGKKFGVTEADMRPALFGWQAIPPEARFVAITEGEIDAMSLFEYQIPALSVPFGGGTGAKHDWIEHEFDNLERCDVIYIAMDNDDVGRQAAAEIIDRLGRHRCRVVELPHKDANDCLRAGLSLAQMQELLSKAKTLDPSELRNAAEYVDGVIAAFNPTQTEIGFSTPWGKCKTLQFRPGELTIVAGVNGHGKSEGVGHITLDAIAQGRRACVASMEFKPQRWLQRLVRQASCVEQPADQYIGKIMEWLGNSLWVFDISKTAKGERMLEVFGYARQRYGINLFVIDNMSKLDINPDDFNRQRDFVDKLTDFAKDHDVHIILVAHLRKGDNDEKPGGKFDVLGGGSTTNLADTVLIWWRNRKKEEKLKQPNLDDIEVAQIQKEPDALCLCEKQRNGEDEPRIALWFHKPSHQFLGAPGIAPRKYVHYSTAEQPNTDLAGIDAEVF
ncbi:toprim domain-containing protein [Methylomonas sp. LW13]|uniref:toprim domain-containing protein n=1 Tax=unclassified Methylomonas TaxID=2608980 RepID=UPI00051C41A2|nr:toprim domain-containing protein [Methylomonas sp. LW13]QBC28836.1 toprim domain-containing protein [Methylomonas sp. LW13]